VSNEQLKLALKAKADLRRRWLYLMPIVFFTYSLAYLGRSNFGFGAAAGLAKSLNITESRAAFLGSVFFIGYFLFQIPAASYARRKSAARLVFFALLSWGILSGLTGVIHDYWLLVIDRTLLGVSESLIFPSMLILLTNWFTREERSRANAILILGNPVTVTWMAAVTGYLIKALGWQMTFIIEGIPSIIWAFVWIMVARDKPHQAAWLHKDSTKALEAALEAEQQDLPKLGSFADALKIPAVILLCVQYFFWSFGVYGLVLWIPEMIRSGSKIGIETIGLLSAAPFLLGVLLMILVSNFSDRMMNRKLFVWPFLCISGLALFISFATAGQNFWIGYIALVIAGGTMYAPYGPFFAIVPEMLPSNVAGEVFALINSFGALGGFAGTWLVGLFQALTGNAKAGYFVMAASLLISGFIIMGLKTKKPVATG